MGIHCGWTIRERELVSELIEAIKEGHKSSLRRAANVLRMEYVTAKNTLYRMRNRYDTMRFAIEEYGKWRRQMRRRKIPVTMPESANHAALKGRVWL